MTEFRIADTFTDSLARLTGDEQKAVKTSAFDLQLNPANPCMKLHRLERSKDRNFWSIRVSSDLRLIVHTTPSAMLLCYVDHHDAAYRWAERRRIERHPTTGAAQLVEVRERVQEVMVHHFVEVVDGAGSPPQASGPRLLFAGVPEEDLLGYGVPPDWLGDVRGATEETLFELAAHLPREAAEALLELATGGIPTPPAPDLHGVDPFAHPDAQRRFRVMADAEELGRALEFPWDRWAVFLHPAQRDLVGRRMSGPARVAGSAGTGKTVVALHRAVWLARAYPGARVLLTTFSDPLASDLQAKLPRLAGGGSEVLDRITVSSMESVGRRVYEASVGPARLVEPQVLGRLLQDASSAEGPHPFPRRFLEVEWSEVVDAWQLTDWPSYRSVPRLGRKTRLGEKQRAVLWSIFERMRSALETEGLLTRATMFGRATSLLASGEGRAHDFVVIDEAQDLGVPELRFLASMAGGKPDGLFFAGDLGQRIFQTPFSWRALGVDVRGRSHTLRINYRTSHQIRRQADRLLPPELTDVDGVVEGRGGTISVFNGPEPAVRILGSVEEEVRCLAAWIRRVVGGGVQPHEVAVFVRSEAELPRARSAVQEAGLHPVGLGGGSAEGGDAMVVGTMHQAKGLEFRAVAVAACDDEVLPLQSRIESVIDESDLEDVYHTERHLLYVACTRARDHLLVTGVDPASEFLDDLTTGPPGDRRP